MRREVADEGEVARQPRLLQHLVSIAADGEDLNRCAKELKNNINILEHSNKKLCSYSCINQYGA